MLKGYHLKWFFIITGILSISGLFLRRGFVHAFSLWELADYILRIAIPLFACWVIHGYFLRNAVFSLQVYTRFFISNLLAVAVLMFLIFAFDHFLPANSLIEDGVKLNTFADFVRHFMRSFVLTIISYVVFYSVYTSSALQTSKLENEILGQAHLRAQLLTLQQQISPHFLFNSLSTLKTIATDQPTKNYIVQLAAVYRYVLNFNEHYLSDLQDELLFIRSYLYILEQRFEDALQVQIDIPDKYLKMKIPPLSLQLLIENAIKHNMVSLDQPLRITIFTDDTPALIVDNNVQVKKTLEEGTGTGLKNIRERYRLLVHRPVTVLHDRQKFSVTLPLLST